MIGVLFAALRCLDTWRERLTGPMWLHWQLGELAVLYPAGPADVESDPAPADPDAAERMVWILPPEAMRTWLDRAAREGPEQVDRLMLELELQEIGDQ